MHWTISRSEWEGHARRQVRASMWGMVSVLAGTVLFGALCTLPWMLGMYAPPANSVGATPALSGIMFKIEACCYVALALQVAASVWVVWSWRRTRHLWTTFPALAWEQNGAACHRCNAALPKDGTACPHGLTVADAPFLRSFWEASATRDVYAVMALSARFPTSRHMHAQRIHQPLVRVMKWSMDPSAPWWRGIAFQSCVFIPVLAIMLFWMGPSIFILSNCLLWVLALPLLTRGLGLLHRGTERCAKCGQMLAGKRPDVCPECGRNLSEPGAVTSATRVRRPGLIVAGAVLGIFFIFMPVLSTSNAVLSVLPTRVLLWMASSSTAFAAEQELAKRTMTPSELQHWSDLLLKKAQTQRFVLNLSTINTNVAAGLLPKEYAERLARAAARAHIEGPDRAVVGQPIELQLVCEAGAMGAPTGQIYYWFFAGWDVDGSPLVGSKDKWIPVDYLDPQSRRAYSPQPVESDYTYRHTFTPTRPGTYKIRASGWITMSTPALSLADTLDEQGRPKKASTQSCYLMDAEHTVVVE